VVQQIVARSDLGEDPLDLLLTVGPGAGRRDAGTRVFKVVDGKLVAVPVQAGIADTAFTEVIGGDVKEGDKLVTRDNVGQGGPQSQVRLRMF